MVETIAGHRDVVSPLQGARDDILSGVGGDRSGDSKSPYILVALLLRGLPFFGFILRQQWDRFWTPQMHTRIAYLSPDLMAALRGGAHGGLTTVEPKSADNMVAPSTTPFVSDGDILTAWFAHHTFLGRSTTKFPTISNVFDARSRMHGVIGPSAVYAQNLVMPTYTFLPRGNAYRISLGQLALLVRKAIVEQTEPSQVRSLLGLIRSRQRGNNDHPRYPLFGKSDSMVFTCTNWSKVKFLEAMDFSAAMKTEESNDAMKGPCSSYWGSTVANTDHPRNVLIVYNRDAGGGYWVHGFLREKTWRRVEEDI